MVMRRHVSMGKSSVAGLAAIGLLALMGGGTIHCGGADGDALPELAAPAAGETGGTVDVDPGIEKAIARKGKARVLIVLRDPALVKQALDIDNTADKERIEKLQAEITKALGTTATIRHRFRSMPVVTAEIGADALAQLKKLSAQVASVMEDVALTSDGEPGWHVTKTHADEGQKLPGYFVPPNSAGGAGAVVAVLDTGFDRSHPSLAGKIVTEHCFASGDVAPEEKCPNGAEEMEGEGSSAPPVGLDPSDTGSWHGTAVADVVAGDIAGVAPAAKIIAIRVFSRFNNPELCGGRPAPCTSVWLGDALRAMEWLLLDEYPQWRAKRKDGWALAALNMSMNFGIRTPEECEADPRTQVIAPFARTFRALGVAPVASSSNTSSSTSSGWPGCIKSFVSVAATTSNDTLRTTSNLSRATTLAAPGQDIIAALPGGTSGPVSGTSFAAPMVAGAIALMRQRAITYFPPAGVKQPSQEPTVDGLVGALVRTGSPIRDTRVPNGLTVSRIDLSSRTFEQGNVYAPTGLEVTPPATPTGYPVFRWRDNSINETTFTVTRSCELGSTAPLDYQYATDSTRLAALSPANATGSWPAAGWPETLARSCELPCNYHVSATLPTTGITAVSNVVSLPGVACTVLPLAALRRQPANLFVHKTAQTKELKELAWSLGLYAAESELEVATDAAYANVVQRLTVRGTRAVAPRCIAGGVSQDPGAVQVPCYWRVRGKNSKGAGPWSAGVSSYSYDW
jgi:subtilisin